MRRALVALAAVAAAAASAAPATAAVPPYYYGINTQWVFDTPQGTWPAQFSAMANGGLTVGRTDARWSIAEPNPPGASGQHIYDWSTFDTIAGTLARYGLKWMPTLDYPPPWAQEDPTDIGSEMTLAHQPDFVAFATALVRRYGPGGDFWTAHPELTPNPVHELEVWNEPNVTYYWDPQTSAPERYADLYLATRDAIKSVTRKIVVMAGGLALVNPPIASDEIKFIKRMFAHRPEVGTQVDMWGLHPYQETIYWTFRRFARWRQALDLLAGRHQPIAINELGYTTTKVSDATRGEELTELTQQFPRSGCDITDFLPYTWLSPEQDTSDPEQWFGIWNHDGTPKPSGQQFIDAVRQMRGLSSTPAPTDQLDLCDSQYPVPPDPQPPLPPQALQVPATPPGPVAPQPPKLRGPGVKFSVRRDRRHGLLKVTARCPTACRLDVYLMTRRTGRHSRLRAQSVKHAKTFTTRARTLTFRIPAHAGRLQPRAQIVVVAFDRAGTSTRTTHVARIR